VIGLRYNGRQLIQESIEMGKRPFLFIIVFCLLWLAACEQVVLERVPTVTAVPPQPTATATTPPTALPSATIVVETAVATTTNTPEPTVVSTSTPIPTPSFFFDVPYSSEIQYQLTTPKPDILLSLMNLPTFSPLIEADLENYYASSFPDADKILEEETLNHDFDIFNIYDYTHIYVQWHPDTNVMKIVDDALENYFGQPALQFVTDETVSFPDWEYTPIEVEFDGDDNPEWLVEIKLDDLNLLKYVAVEENESGGYDFIPNDLPNFYRSMWYPTQVADMEDVNGDDLLDVILLGEAELMAGGYLLNISAYSWNGQELVRLNGNASYEGQVSEFPEVSITDVNQDGVSDIQVAVPYEEGFDCAGEKVDVFSWRGYETQHQIAVDGLPDTLMCNLYRATMHPNNIYFAPLPEKQQLLESSLAQLKQETGYPKDWTALTLSHLAIANYLQGNEEKAQQTIEEIYDLTDESDYANIVLSAYEEGEKDILSMCRNLFMNANQSLETTIGEYLIDGWAGYSLYPDYIADRSLVCDLGYVVQTIIGTTTIPITNTPPQALAELGIQYEFAQAINLDEDSDLEWIGILEPISGVVWRFDLNETEWIGKGLYHASPSLLANYEVTEIDVTGDGELDSVSLTTTQIECRELDAIAFEQSTKILYTSDESASFDGKIFPCRLDNLLTINDVGADDFQLLPSYQQKISWKTLADFPQADTYLLDYLYQLQTAVLTQSDPAIANKITDLLAYLPTDDPEAQPYREHLTYLLGYHFELSGDDEQAVATYLDLIQQAPSSPWSWLAWARLEPEA